MSTILLLFRRLYTVLYVKSNPYDISQNQRLIEAGSRNPPSPTYSTTVLLSIYTGTYYLGITILPYWYIQVFLELKRSGCIVLYLLFLFFIFLMKRLVGNLVLLVLLHIRDSTLTVLLSTYCRHQISSESMDRRNVRQ